MSNFGKPNHRTQMMVVCGMMGLGTTATIRSETCELALVDKEFCAVDRIFPSRSKCLLS